MYIYFISFILLLPFTELFALARAFPEPDFLELLIRLYPKTEREEITIENVCIKYEKALEKGNQVRRLQLAKLAIGN